MSRRRRPFRASKFKNRPKTQLRGWLPLHWRCCAAVEVLPALTHALGESWQVREEAAGTLGKLKLIGAVEHLIRAMDDRYWQVRVRAARSLGRLKAARALEVLAAALRHEIGNLRKEAAIALGEIGDLRAIPALESALKDPDPDVRKLTQLALKQIQSANTAR